VKRYNNSLLLDNYEEELKYSNNQITEVYEQFKSAKFRMED